MRGAAADTRWTLVAMRRIQSGSRVKFVGAVKIVDSTWRSAGPHANRFRAQADSARHSAARPVIPGNVIPQQLVVQRLIDVPVERREHRGDSFLGRGRIRPTRRSSEMPTDRCLHGCPFEHLSFDRRGCLASALGHSMRSSLRYRSRRWRAARTHAGSGRPWVPELTPPT